MTKEQFIEVLSGFVAERLVKALAEQAENKGYFNEDKPIAFAIGRKAAPVEKYVDRANLLKPINDLAKHIENFPLGKPIFNLRLSEIIERFDTEASERKVAFDVGFPNDSDNELLIKTAQKKANLRRTLKKGLKQKH